MVHARSHGTKKDQIGDKKHTFYNSVTSCLGSLVLNLVAIMLRKASSLSHSSLFHRTSAWLLGREAVDASATDSSRPILG